MFLVSHSKVVDSFFDFIGKLDTINLAQFGEIL